MVEPLFPETSVAIAVMLWTCLETPVRSQEYLHSPGGFSVGVTSEPSISNTTVAPVSSTENIKNAVLSPTRTELFGGDIGVTTGGISSGGLAPPKSTSKRKKAG